MKTHPLNVSYLVVGLVFLGISGSWALRAAGAVDRGDTHWMVPAVLLLAGVVGLVAVAAKGLGRGRGTDDAPAYDPYPATYDEPTTRFDTDTHPNDEGESR